MIPLNSVRLSVVVPNLEERLSASLVNQGGAILEAALARGFFFWRVILCAQSRLLAAILGVRKSCIFSSGSFSKHAQSVPQHWRREFHPSLWYNMLP